MITIQLEPGDIFCTRNPMWLGRAINAVQRFHSVDNQSEYSHAGIVIDPDGGSFESLWTIRRSHIDIYEGKKVLVGRHEDMTRAMATNGLEALYQEHLGQIYPAHRLIFHLIPPLAKYISSGHFPVCSELAAKFLCKCGLLGYWKGVNPDHIADMIHNFRYFEVVYEGIW